MFIGKNIKYLRESNKMTQIEFAEVMGLKSHTMIGNYEKAKVIPSIESLQRIADYFKIDLQFLIFSEIETGSQRISGVVDKDRVTRLLEKELDRLEALEKELKETPGALEALRKVAPELAKKIEQN